MDDSAAHDSVKKLLDLGFVRWMGKNKARVDPLLEKIGKPQLTPGVPASPATGGKAALIAEVREDLIVIADTADTIALKEPGFDASFQLGANNQRDTLADAKILPQKPRGFRRRRQVRRLRPRSRLRPGPQERSRRHRRQKRRATRRQTGLHRRYRPHPRPHQGSPRAPQIPRHLRHQPLPPRSRSPRQMENRLPHRPRPAQTRRGNRHPACSCRSVTPPTINPSNSGGPLSQAARFFHAAAGHDLHVANKEAPHSCGAVNARSLNRAKLYSKDFPFASTTGVSWLLILQNREQGHRHPEGTARALLRVAESHPEAVLEALHR